MVTCIYLTEETKDHLKKQLLREMNRRELGWEEKEMVKSILDKQKKEEEYQRQRQARYNKYILKGRSQEEYKKLTDEMK